MIELTNEFKNRVVAALAVARDNYDGSDAAFAKKIGISSSIYNRVKGGVIDKIMRPEQWLSIGRLLDVSPDERKWNMARTEVFDVIEEEVKFCQEFAKSKIFVDDCAIGKTYSAKYLSRTLKNCFYVDASQCKTKIAFARALAKCIGVESLGTYVAIKENIKYYLNVIQKPIVIIDEAGDLSTEAFLDIKELWNATDGACGWYMLGADGLRAKIERGINGKRNGYKEIFSRMSDKFTSVVPNGRQDKITFYRKLITDVLSVNMSDKTQLNKVVNRCLSTDTGAGEASGLRRAESLLILMQ